MVDIANLTELAEEFKIRIAAKKLLVDMNASDPGREVEAQEILRSIRWEKTIRDVR